MSERELRRRLRQVKTQCQVLIALLKEKYTEYDRLKKALAGDDKLRDHER